MAIVRRSKYNKETLRKLVVARASEAFAISGIKNVHMDDIANSLSISKRTLYELCGDKEQLLLEVFSFHQKEMNDYMRKIASNANNVLEVIFAFYKKKLNELANTNPVFLRDLRKYPNVLESLRQSRKKDNEIAQEYFNKGVEQGIFRPDINFEIINQAMSMQLDILIFSDLTDTYPLVEIFREITILHMRGITTEKGIRMVDAFLQTV